MSEVDYVELQQGYGRRYVATRDGHVIASAETYDELSQRLEEARAEWAGLTIEYVEPPDTVGV